MVAKILGLCGANYKAQTPEYQKWLKSDAQTYSGKVWTAEIRRETGESEDTSLNVERFSTFAYSNNYKNESLEKLK